MSPLPGNSSSSTSSTATAVAVVSMVHLSIPWPPPWECGPTTSCRVVGKETAAVDGNAQEMFIPLQSSVMRIQLFRACYDDEEDIQGMKDVGSEIWPNRSGGSGSAAGISYIG